MSHTTVDEEAAGRAALYALGALEGDEAREFEEHLAAGCLSCAAELREYEAVAGQLGLAAPEAEPPAGVRARLLELVSGERSEPAPGVRRQDSPGFLVVRAGEGRWLPTGEAGVSFKLLYEDKGRGTFTTLVRMEPGASIPAHRHLGVEQCLVIEGDLRAGGVEMSAGDFNCSLPGSVHEELRTDGGALFLIVGPERYEVVERHA